MVSKILNATTAHLYSNFGDKYKYYVEDVEQNLTKPCFTVDVLIPTRRIRSSMLYDCVVPLVLHYFPKDKKDTKMECYTIGEELISCLEYLPVDNGLLRGENISWQIVDDEVLQVFVTYRFIAKKISEFTDDMESLVEIITIH